jgi:hypothetical protein
MKTLSVILIMVWLVLASFYYGHKIGLKEGSFTITCHKAFDGI